jgi:hypothetical protein
MLERPRKVPLEFSHQEGNHDSRRSRLTHLTVHKNPRTLFQSLLNKRRRFVQDREKIELARIGHLDDSRFYTVEVVGRPRLQARDTQYSPDSELPKALLEVFGIKYDTSHRIRVPSRELCPQKQPRSRFQFSFPRLKLIVFGIPRSTCGGRAFTRGVTLALSPDLPTAIDRENSVDTLGLDRAERTGLQGRVIAWLDGGPENSPINHDRAAPPRDGVSHFSQFFFSATKKRLLSLIESRWKFPPAFVRLRKRRGNSPTTFRYARALRNFGIVRSE